MKTLLKFGLIGLIVLLVAVYFVGSAALNTAIKAGVETIAPKVLGVSVNVQEIDISPFSGSGTVKGLAVGNPKGYSDNNAFSFQEVHVNIDIMSLFTDVKRIQEVRVIKPEFNFEKKLMSSNVSDLLKAIEGGKTEESTEAEPATETSSSDASQMKFQVDSLLIEGGSVRMATLGAGVTLPLPTLSLKDLGKDGGIAPDEAVAEVLGVVLSGITQAIASGGGKILETGGDAVEGVGDAAEGVIKGLKGLF